MSARRGPTPRASPRISFHQIFPYLLAKHYIACLKHGQTSLTDHMCPLSGGVQVPRADVDPPTESTGGLRLGGGSKPPPLPAGESVCGRYTDGKGTERKPFGLP